MKLPALLVASVLFAAPIFADVIAPGVEFTPARNWSVGRPTEQELSTPFPTVKYVPKGDRNAAILLTAIPVELVQRVAAAIGVEKAGTSADRRLLEAMLHVACTPFLPHKGAAIDMKEFQARQRTGLYATFKDPSLVGKPPQKGNYKVATSAVLLASDKIFIQASLFTDSTEGVDFQEGMAMLKSIVGDSAAAHHTVKVPNPGNPGRFAALAFKDL